MLRLRGRGHYVLQLKGLKGLHLAIWKSDHNRRPGPDNADRLWARTVTNPIALSKVVMHGMELKAKGPSRELRPSGKLDLPRWKSAPLIALCELTRS
jgi:hypothetical protein